MPVRPLASHRARSAIYLLVLNQQTMAIPRSLAESLQENNIPPSGRRSPIGDGDTHRSRKQSGACLRLARISPQSRSAAPASRAPTASTLPIAPARGCRRAPEGRGGMLQPALRGYHRFGRTVGRRDSGSLHGPLFGRCTGSCSRAACMAPRVACAPPT